MNNMKQQAMDRAGEISEALLPSSDWFSNPGKCPVSENTYVDVIYEDGFTRYNAPAYDVYWAIENGVDVTYWRLHKPEKTLEDAYDEPSSSPLWEYHELKYPETKPIVIKKSVEQLAIDVLFNTTGKLYTEREIVAVVSIYESIRSLENS